MDAAVGLSFVPDDERAQPFVARCDVVQGRLQGDQVQPAVQAPARGDDVPRPEGAEIVVALVESAHERLAGRKSPPIGDVIGGRELVLEGHRTAIPLLARSHP